MFIIINLSSSAKIWSRIDKVRVIMCTMHNVDAKPWNTLYESRLLNQCYKSSLVDYSGEKKSTAEMSNACGSHLRMQFHVLFFKLAAFDQLVPAACCHRPITPMCHQKSDAHWRCVRFWPPLNAQIQSPNVFSHHGELDACHFEWLLTRFLHLQNNLQRHCLSRRICLNTNTYREITATVRAHLFSKK